MYGFGGLGHTSTVLSFRLVEPPMFTCCTGYYLVVLSQYGSVLVGTWWYWVNTDLKFVKKFTRPNFRAKEFYTLKTRKSRLFSPAINSENASLSVIWPSFG